jgi:NAD(P)-dependent dehydrogenase (short-subunit alcohol dehydrogenase family)
VNYVKDKASAETVVSAIEKEGGKARAFRADIAKETEVLELFHFVDNAFGRLDALINNAGILETQMHVEQMTEARLQRIFQTNVIAPFICSREAIKRMAARHGGPGGVIVNVSSGASRGGSPNEYVDYAASKGAIDTFTIGLAKELAEENIRVNAVRPGVIYTDIHASGGEPDRVERVKNTIPMKRGGYPEEVAATITWLLTEAPPFLTGAIIDITGGR